MNYSFNLVWNRIRRECDISNITQLSKIIETSQSNVSKKKKADLFPPEWGFKIAQEYGLSTDWIMTGKGAKIREDEVQNNHIATTDFKKRKSNAGCKFLKDVDEWIAEKKEEEPKFETWFEVEFKTHFPGYREWAQRRDETERFNDAVPGAA
ncbi:MAG: bacteriophage CI repressor [Desulfobacterales bacterium]|nr:bacteriophage CI repressor [Desulfobacterales bacterium]